MNPNPRIFLALLGALLSLSLSANGQAPQISEHPQSQVLPTNAQASFSVTASGAAPLLYQWYYNNGLIAGATNAAYQRSALKTNDSGNYRVIVSNTSGSDTSTVAVLNVYLRPQITAYPTNRTVTVGSSVTFAVTAKGSEPLTYTWAGSTGANPYFEVPGVTGPTLTLTNVQPEDAGVYYVFVTNPLGQEYQVSSLFPTNRPAVLSVLTPPNITGHPVRQVANVGEDASFDVTVEGSEPLSFQWYFNNGKTTVALTGEKQSVYIRYNCKTNYAGQYYVVITNSVGRVVSSNASLAVYAPPAITTQPVDKSARLGTNVTFFVRATGTAPLGYQWHLDGFPITGATATNYIITRVTTDHAGIYTCVVTNLAGAATSREANLIVNVPPTIIEQPLSQTGNEGEDITFNVAAEGTEPFTYQWYKNKILIAGETDSALTLSEVATNAMGAYTVVIKNAGGAITSAVANLVVIVPAQIVKQPVDMTAVVGTNLTFSVTAKGTKTLAYQWYFDGTPIPKATNTTVTFKVTNTVQSGYYSVEVSNAGGAETSEEAYLRVIEELIKPVIFITNFPTTGGRVLSNLVTIRGKASDNKAVKLVQVRANSDPYVTATNVNNKWSNWWAPVMFRPGTNIVQAIATDTSDNVSFPATCSIFYSVSNRVTLRTNGVGAITGVLNNQWLEIGRGYTVTATPGTGYLFSGWTGYGSAGTTMPFLMQSNLVLEANFVRNPFLTLKGVYNGLFYRNSMVRLESSGLMNLTVTDKGTFSGKLVMGASSLPLNGTFDVRGNYRGFVPRMGKSSLTVLLNLDVSNRTDRITGSVTDGLWNAALQADRAVYSATTNKAPMAGRYTLFIPSMTNNSPGLPAGDGYGLVTIDSGGNIALTGALADGSPISQGVPISKHGQWPLYVPVYGGKGALLSWVTFTNRGVSSLEGMSSWIKQGGVFGNYYKAGFTNESYITGSSFRSPSNKVSVLAFTNGWSILLGGNLATSFTNSIRLTNNTVVVNKTGPTNKLSLTLNLTSGQVSGSFYHPAKKAVVPIQGVMLQQQTNARGFFLGTNQGGQFWLGQ